MRVVQHNCNLSQALCIATFESAKTVGADIVCIQKTYDSGDVLSHKAFDIICGMLGKEREESVAIGI